MRRFLGFLLLVLTTVLVRVLDRPLGALPAIGKLLDPINGCWANAEPVNEDFSANHALKGVHHGATVWFDERMVPHIHANDDHDLFFMEGYIHAMFRLWQMDMETRAAAGRVSEVVGEKALNFDRKQRRKGMGYGAENSLKAMEADPHTKLMMDAYTEGINSYIATLRYKQYPLEYKLMGFAPEKWTNLKIALLLKYMADDLTGKTDDIALTYLRDVLPKNELDLLFPDRIEGSTPAIPAGTVFDKPSIAIPAAPKDSAVFPHFAATDFGEKAEDGKGSNNWALSGAKTASGAAILCNDPHLGLNLPSLWYEAQLQAPGMNVYGASLPGTPGVIIGFNDNLTWGFTNNYRDVKDFYLIKPVAGDKNKYWFAGRQLDFTKRIEHILVKGKPEIIDTIDYTIHGPVTYEQQNGKDGGLRKPLAMCWMGHKGTNEMLAIYLMNKAKNYNEFVDGIMNFQCPAQNMAYADVRGNIALWGQGQFVNKWKDQGKYVMDGSDSATLWKELIPMRENPHVLNPVQGYVSSANQITTDSTYPYNYNGSGWTNLRAWRINEVLGNMQKATMKDMFALQNDIYSILAAKTLPIMLKYLQNDTGLYTNNDSETNRQIRHFIDHLNLANWDYKLTAESSCATFYHDWWNLFYSLLWKKIEKVPNDFLPLQERTMQLMQDSSEANKLFQDQAKKAAYESFNYLNAKYLNNELKSWYNDKNTTINHLAKLPAFSYSHLKIGGWGNTVNAAKGDHGPSWRMVVQMGKEIEAYGVYPGGQSGNPGSKHYGDFIQHWADGEYYRLLFLPNAVKQDNKRIKYTWSVD
jgi:penicillin G amidase